MKIIKNNYKFILILFLIICCFSIRFPYYIDAPGGISDVSDKIEIDGYESKGSFNLAYVKEYRATLPTLLISLFNKDWNVYKEEEILLENETDETYLLRDKILMEESISNAISVAYNYANKDIKVTENKLYVTYIVKEANTDLKVGDEIKKINNIQVESKSDISNIIENSEMDDKLSLIVENNGIEYTRYAYVILEDDSKKIGILISNLRKYETKPDINVTVSEDESGSSGGLITALSIYNSLVSHDITNGKKIVGTGTIDLDGKVGSIGGVEYKLKSAVKSDADIFLVPKDENYSEALKIKKENDYSIEIIGVSTFEEAVRKLENLN